LGRHLFGGPIQPYFLELASDEPIGAETVPSDYRSIEPTLLTQVSIDALSYHPWTDNIPVIRILPSPIRPGAALIRYVSIPVRSEWGRIPPIGVGWGRYDCFRRAGSGMRIE
jgi:hypothetical protein